MSGNNRSRGTLSDIMLRRYLRLGESHTLAEVMGFLTDPHFEKDGLPFLVVIAEDGTFSGMLQPKAIFKHLVQGNSMSGDEGSIIDQAGERLSTRVADVMHRGIPALPPTAPLEEAFTCIHQSPTECIAVIEENRIIGLVTSRLLFETASSLTVGALSGGVIPPKA